jgi:hypothetical protein
VSLDKGQPGLGLGAATEADLFRQEYWDQKGCSERIRLVSLHELPQDSIPVRLRPVHRFRPFEADAELDQLVRWTAGRLGLSDIEPPTVRWPEPVAFTPNIADRSHEEWPALKDLLAGRSRARILLYEGASGLGKSLLVREALRYGRTLGIPVAHIDFKGGGSDIEAILGQIDLDLGAHLPDFSQHGGNKTHLLRKDLRALRHPVLLCFDTYEHAADNRNVADWLSIQLLAEAETSLALAVIVAGQRVPPMAAAPWRELARHLVLKPIEAIEHWEPWLERRHPGVDLAPHLNTVLKLAQGNPANVATYCEILAAQGGA